MVHVGTMQLRLKNRNDVRLFAIVITMIAMAGCYVLQRLLMPTDVFPKVFFHGELIAVMVASPISYYVGTKMLDINNLTVQLEYAVNHDNLTGACTRLSFYRRLELMDEVPTVMIVTDIDHFKQVNDSYGHQAGDSVLKQFANTLLRNCREEDVIARFGGEEFLILLRNTRLEEGMLVAQRVCDHIRGKKFVADGQQMYITASFGVAEVISTSEIDDAIRRADLASFRAKREGRDRGCCYDPDLDDTSYSDQAEK